jgi:hypothetical protein
MPMCYVRGNTIKYLRIPEAVRAHTQHTTHKRKTGFRVARSCAALSRHAPRAR